MIRCLLLLLAGLLLGAAAPPPVLAPYVADGVFRPGDYQWMRGKFPEANAQDKAAWAAAAAWIESCMAEGEARLRRDLKALGIRDPKVSPQPYRDVLCRSVADHNVDPAPWPSFAAFLEDLERARPIAESFLFATALAVEHGGPRGPTLADRLTARPLGEQILRSAIGWGEGRAGAAPALPARVRTLVLNRIGAAIAEADHANSEYLKEIVAKQGWPDRKEVGDYAAHMAWLTAQHADLDPVFQLQVLRLMEPKLATRGVHPGSYAYLYDRVMLKLEGRQRYGTQTICSKGAYVPQPLEDAAKVDALRAAAELEPLADYLRGIGENSPRCPAV